MQKCLEPILKYKIFDYSLGGYSHQYPMSKKVDSPMSREQKFDSIISGKHQIKEFHI
jgi:hypothetical protein